jgi:hypothetical protein
MKTRHVMSVIALVLGVSTLRALGQSDASKVHTPENHRPIQAPTPAPTPPNKLVRGQPPVPGKMPVHGPTQVHGTAQQTSRQTVGQSGTHGAAALRPQGMPSRSSQGAGVIHVNQNVTASVRPRSNAITLTRADADGSKLVVKQRFAGGQSRLLNAYSSRTDAASGVTTRTYLDGYKVATGRNFTRFEVPGRYALTTHADGLREANGANGKPLYHDAWATRDAHGVAMQSVVRTVYSETINGRVVDYADPVLRVYTVEKFFGVRALAYQPLFFAADFYGPFLSGLPQPLPVGPGCDICPAPVVAYEVPVEGYTDPLALVGDLEIATAASAVGDASVAPTPDPDVDYLSQQVADLQQEVEAAQADDPQLTQELESVQQQREPPPAPRKHKVKTKAPTESPPPEPSPTAAPAAQTQPVQQASTVPQPQQFPDPQFRSAVAYTVPEDVRQQIHSQVRENVKLHQQKRALTWPELVSSGQSGQFIFQVSEAILTVDTSGEDCALTGGDMLKLDVGAAPDDPTLRMRVVTSKTTSCPVSAIVNVSISDAQNMLNDFNARQENIMNQVHSRLSGTTQI